MLMSSNASMKARITFLHNTEADWLKLDFIPKAGELIIYDEDEKYNYPRVKIGDGSHSLKNLPFFIEEAILDRRLEAIDGGRLEYQMPEQSE
jgi:hypothetical protein